MAAALTQLGVSARAEGLCSVPGAQAEVLAASSALNACAVAHGIRLGEPNEPLASGPCARELKRVNAATAACRPQLCADPRYEATAAQMYKTQMGCASREAARLAGTSGDDNEVVARAIAACQPDLMKSVAFFSAHCSSTKDGSAAEGWVFAHLMVMRAVALGAVRRARAATDHPAEAPSR